jgi:hypothetical protein
MDKRLYQTAMHDHLEQIVYMVSSSHRSVEKTGAVRSAYPRADQDRFLSALAEVYALRVAPDRIYRRLTTR